MINDYNKITQSVDLGSLKNKRVLITGANGLIGGYLAEFFSYLNTLDYNIELVLTSLSNEPARLHDILKGSKVTYIPKNLAIDSEWQDVGEIDYCFYCAGYAQPSKFMSKPIDTLNLNIGGLYNTLTAIFANKKATFIYLSSSEIYSGSDKQTAHTEEDKLCVDMLNKRNPYILGKLCGESIINDFRAKGMNAISARVSLCYGPGVLFDDARVLSEIVRKGLSTSTEIELFDDGSASRRYLHICDCVVMLLNITLQGRDSVYNVCGVEERTIYDLATIVGEYVNKPVKKGSATSLVSQTAPKVVWNSLHKYNAEFGELSYRKLDNGVVEFIEWYKNNII
jgi:UDP-glucuronate decarboxylase